MTAQLLSIGTAVPSAALSQRATRDFFREQPDVDRLTARLIGAAFDQSAIETRYSVLGSIGEGETRFIDEDQRLRSPGTGERNALYRAEAPPLFLAAARDALERADCDPADVTHVVTASCTGSFAPGPDFLLVRQLGVPATAERYHIGFMGCAAAFPALRAAAMLPSREVLRDYGNMSSATILFILQRVLADEALPDGARVAGLCFGPGLTVETVDLTRRAVTGSVDPDLTR